MKKQKIIGQFLFLMINIIILTQILPQANAKYVEKISYSVQKQTQETLEPTFFSYTGEVQEFTAPYTGHYAIQLWGADGRAGAFRWAWLDFTDTNKGGEGGYIVAQIYLKRGETISVRVGGTNTSATITDSGYNAGLDGGCGSHSDTGGIIGMGTDYAGGGGGGATDIRINEERLLVAGGGGGGAGRDTVSVEGGVGGHAQTSESANGGRGTSENSGAGGTITAGGAGNVGGVLDPRLDGDLEKGGTSEMMTGNSGYAGGGGGGGGYYGGGAAGAASDAGGGGSSMRIGPRMKDLSVIAHEDLPMEPTQDERGGRESSIGFAKHGYVIISYLDPENLYKNGEAML